MMQPSKTYSRLALRIMAILLVVAILMSFAPTEQAQAARCKFKHKVKAGETLIYIADLYQTDWKEIAEANDLKEPYILTVGQVLCIPNGTKPVPTTTTTTSSTGTPKEPTITVGSGPNSVYVRLDYFPKFIVYHIRIIPLGGNPGLVNPDTPPPSPPPGEVEYRVARIKTDKNGYYEDWLRIPGYVPETRWMMLCVKNVWTDAVKCIKYEHPWWSLWVDLPLDQLGR